jgi:L-ascorbate metabolism protein UlaG (beta-lactamase superfamily)
MRRGLAISMGLVAILLVAAALGLAFVWNDRPDPLAAGIPGAPESDPGAEGVRVAWLGVTTLLFDDGETRILTDGFFSRPGLLDLALDRPVAPDLAGIERALAEGGIVRVAAVIPVHSHYDHAMDAGEVAKRTGALVVGSASTAQVARGAGLPEERIVEAGLPEERIVVPAEGTTLRFGAFTVTLHRSRHAPLDDGQPPFPGTIDTPLVPPAPVSAWREGASFSVLVAHPRGTALVQGSAGYVEDALEGVGADVVLLGVGGLARLGRDHAGRYWREIVARTGSRRVFPIHWDDFTLPYGDVRAFPRALEDLEASLAWLLELAREGEPPVRVELLPFRRPVGLY